MYLFLSLLALSKEELSMLNPFRREQNNIRSEDKDPHALWNERLALLETLFGKSDETVRHGIIPFVIGANAGGTADVVCFSSHVPGRLAVTSELIGCEGQKASPLGNYELAIAHRDPEEEWGANLICRLAQYTLMVALKPGETMDIGPAAPTGSTIDAFLFFDYGSFQFRGTSAGVLLCMGITKKEKEACLAGRKDTLVETLKATHVFPYTDLVRQSVI